MLTRLSGGGSLDESAAASYERMSAQFGRPLPVTSAARSHAEQVRIFRNRYRQGVPSSRDKRGVLWDGVRWYWHSGPSTAAVPGTSKHEAGLAVDFMSPAYAWLEVHASEHGWVRTISAERWHYEYVMVLDRHRTAVQKASEAMADYLFVAPGRGHFLVAAGFSNTLEEGSAEFRAEKMAVLEKYFRRPGHVITITFDNGREFDVAKALFTQGDPVT